MPQTHRLNLPSVGPRQQLENKNLWNESRSADDADFFTLGYTGRTWEQLVESLLNAGIRTLVDIRQNAVSMYRPELSKNNLRSGLAAVGIAYVHEPSLGVPKDIRAKAVSTGNRDVIWDWYDEHVAEPYARRRLHHFLNTVEHPVAMMCAELDPTECHRHRLCVALEHKGLRGFDL